MGSGVVAVHGDSTNAENVNEQTYGSTVTHNKTGASVSVFEIVDVLLVSVLLLLLLVDVDGSASEQLEKSSKVTTLSKHEHPYASGA